MSLRRRTTYRNRLGLPALLVVLVVVASLALVGIGIAVSKNRVRALGEEQRRVESDIRLLKDEIVRLEQAREKALASQRLQPRLTKISADLLPLEKSSILLLPALEKGGLASEPTEDSPGIPRLASHSHTP